jgi:hypothetical protein
MAFIDNGTDVTDETTGYIWKKDPSNTKLLWDKAAADAPSGWRLPTLAELQTLIADQKANLADCALAFGDNLPTDWFWVYKIDPARENVWDASGKTAIEAEAIALEKPGHVAAYFVWMGFTPANRRVEQALCRYIKIDSTLPA